MTRDGPKNAHGRDIEIEDNGITTGIGGGPKARLDPIDKNNTGNA